METKYVRVPFEVELAKKIQNKECDGRIVTDDGRSVRIVCWDRKCVEYPIIALIDNDEKGEGFGLFTTDGKITYQSLNLILEIPEYMTFNGGDVLIDRAGEPFIYNGVKHNGYGYICGINYNGRLCISSNSNNNNSSQTDIVKGRATEQEKQKLIDALKASDDPIAKEYLKRFFEIEEKPEYKFKPFDKVLVRVSKKCTWNADFYSYYDDRNKVYIGIGSISKYCIPYKGNEHLLGTIEDVNNNKLYINF